MQFLLVEKRWGRVANRPTALMAFTFEDAVQEASSRLTFEHEKVFLYTMDDEGIISLRWESGDTVEKETIPDVPEQKCVHCGEPVERRSGEVVTKYGNDPQCDASPNDNHKISLRSV